MESAGQTPNKIEHKGDDIELKTRLRALLERELEKSPDKLDIEKIDSVTRLLKNLSEDKPAETELSKEEFANKYLKEIIKISKKDKRHFRAAIIFITVIVCSGIGNIISVKATNKDLFSFVKEKAYLFYYETLGNNKELDSQDITDYVQDVHESIYESWDELKENSDIDVLMPCYVPDGFEAMPIHLQRASVEDIGISLQYVKDELYVKLLIRTVSENGKMMYSVDKYAELTDKKIINGNEVFLFQTEDKLQLLFQAGQYIYIMDTNIYESEAVKIIEEMR